MDNESATAADAQANGVRERIIDAYWDAYLNEGERPASIYKFCKELGIGEKEFYLHFGSFSAVESIFWRETVEHTIATLEADAEYASYPARQRLLAFFYTYFEATLAYRSRFLAAFPRFRPMQPADSLKKFRSCFKEWSEQVIKDGIDASDIQDRKDLSDRYPDFLFGHFWYLIDYNLRDESERFQDTDALIEKSVTTFFDAVRTQVFDSAFDLLKFLVRIRD